MDIRVYYQKVRQSEATIAKDYVSVVSLDTADGGRSGVVTEVSRYTAAKLVVEGKARLATEAEVENSGAEPSGRSEDLGGCDKGKASASPEAVSKAQRPLKA
jgi:hypothetical protein